MAAPRSGLTVAVTGPTGTFGHGLIPLLQADDRIERIVGIARGPFDPADNGWTKMEYRCGDVRDYDALRQAFTGADVVVHLAFIVTGNAGRAAVRAINVHGTRNAFAAAAAAGATRFVYASSVAAYGFHADNPIGMTEAWPVRPATHFFYGQDKADVEHELVAEAARHPGIDVYMLRPSVVLGPHCVGAKRLFPRALEPFAGRLAAAVARMPRRLPALVPNLPLQFIHEHDVGEALRLCIAGSGPPGAYNIAGDGALSAVDVARELGFLAVAAPAGPFQALARAASALPFAPPVAEWPEALSHPAIMDTAKAKGTLGWNPRFTGLEALRETLAALSITPRRVPPPAAPAGRS